MTVVVKRCVVNCGWLVAKGEKCRHICDESCSKFLNRTPGITVDLARSISVYWETSNGNGYK
jgi:hypothetical protein